MMCKTVTCSGLSLVMHWSPVTVLHSICPSIGGRLSGSTCACRSLVMVLVVIRVIRGVRLVFG